MSAGRGGGREGWGEERAERKEGREGTKEGGKKRKGGRNGRGREGLHDSSDPENVHMISSIKALIIS